MSEPLDSSSLALSLSSLLLSVGSSLSEKHSAKMYHDPIPYYIHTHIHIYTVYLPSFNRSWRTGRNSFAVEFEGSNPRTFWHRMRAAL